MNDERLRHLLGDAVSDVEPHDRIEELRASVRPTRRGVPLASRPSWHAAAGIVATAAVIGIVAYLTAGAGDPSTDLGPAGAGDGSAPTAIATDTAAVQPRTDDGGAARQVTVFSLGRGSQGDMLFARTTPVTAGSVPLATAVAGLSADPPDRDHRPAWQPGWLVAAHLVDGLITVDLGSAPPDRPASMSARTAYEIVQAAVYTLQSASRSSAPVLFLRHGEAIGSVLGVAASQPFTAERAWDVVSPVAITRPSTDGRRLRVGPLVVTGLSTAPGGGNVAVELIQALAGPDRVVGRRHVQVPAPTRGDGLATWRVTLDTSRLAPGRYTVRASTDGYSGETRASDTRVVVLR